MGEVLDGKVSDGEKRYKTFGGSGIIVEDEDAISFF